MPKTNTTVEFNRDAIARILGTQVEGNKEFQFEELVDAQKFCGFILDVPVESKDGVTVTTKIEVSKQELDALLLDHAKGAAKLTGVSSSVVKYTFADVAASRAGAGVVVESVEVILNSITR